MQPMLAHVWQPGSVDVTEFVASEKLDGVRCIWDGTQFLSRNGNVFNAPAWFAGLMPDAVLDGELWGGRGRFQSTVSAVRKKVPVDSEWDRISYVAFDLPEHGGTFAERMVALEQMVEDEPNLFPVPRFEVQDEEMLMARLKEVTALGAEGLMLNRKDALYEGKRSRSLLKVKTMLDASAIVIGYEPGKGKHKGRMGALICRDEHGMKLSIGTGFTDEERETPPAIGARIDFTYAERTRDNQYRFPSFSRVR